MEEILSSVTSDFQTPNRIKYVIQKEHQGTTKTSHFNDEKNTKEYKLMTEMLIHHTLEKSQLISPEILDKLEYQPRSPIRKSKKIECLL